MPLFSKKPRHASPAGVKSTSRPITSTFGAFETYQPLCPQKRLYELMREAVPLIDASIGKIIRLVGSFRVQCENQEAGRALSDFLAHVPLSAHRFGIDVFLSGYLDSLLTYGNAVGEILYTADGRYPVALLNHPVDSIVFLYKDNPLESVMCSVTQKGYIPVPYPQRVLFSALGAVDPCERGKSLLSGLEFVCGTLLKIYQCIGSNFERVGNARFAVTYHPPAEGLDAISSKAVSEEIAREWSAAMQATKNGQIRDFVAVGDVDVKVIGADNQLPDTEVPVRQILEQIIAKLGIPPFLLGLNWSTTERMSTQQADILTSELESYRRILTPILVKICRSFLLSHGYPDDFSILWDTINLQDEVERAKAKLYTAQAYKLDPKTQKPTLDGGDFSSNV